MEMTTNLKKTALNEMMKSAGGKMVDFYGWQLPVQFAGILAEHKSIREHCGIFDVSHMGNVFIKGKDAHKFVQTVNSNNIKAEPGKGVYSHVLNEKGGAVDDVIVFCINENEFYLVVNATTTEKDFNWFKENSKGFDVEITNKSADYQMIALQGPKAPKLMDELCPDAGNLARFGILQAKLAGFDTIITRTGYTGEDGFEIAADAKAIIEIYNLLMQKGEKYNIAPCGLGARDTLRLEAGYLLYGQDTDDNHTPYEAGYGWVVKLKKETDFIGKSALIKQKEEGIKTRLTGFKLLERGVPRNGCEIHQNGKCIGALTSATYSPVVKAGIGVGYVPVSVKEGDEVEILIHSRPVKAQVVKTPFYQNKV